MCSLLTKAFDLKTDFGISYKTKDPSGVEVWLLVLTDWDLDAAFLRAHNLSIINSSEPCLTLKVELKPSDGNNDKWENQFHVVKQESINVMQQQLDAGHKYLLNRMEKTFSIVQKALNFVDEQTFLPSVLPLSDMEFRKYCDSVGQIIHAQELRKVIYFGGIDPSLRRVLWKYLLNVYPAKLTGKERMDYAKKMSNEYFKLRDTWRESVESGNVDSELKYFMKKIKDDVNRTDKLEPFYAGSDDNKNVIALYNILVTYSLNHPSVSYCQGMSDFCSTILVAMQADEAQAYISFCALMRRIKSNFMIDGIAMTQNFESLSEVLEYYDPDFYAYLKLHQADDLLWCYRWLLLELKREFAFNDALLMLEVLWSTIPPDPPEFELPLFETKFCVTPENFKDELAIKQQPRENAYTKICELRRQNSAMSIKSLEKRFTHITEDNSLQLNINEIEKSICCASSDESSLNSLADNTNPFLENGNEANEDDGKETKLVKNFNEFWNLKVDTQARFSKSESIDDSSPENSQGYVPMTLGPSKKNENSEKNKTLELVHEYTQLPENKIDTEKIPSPDEYKMETRVNSGIYIWQNPIFPIHENVWTLDLYPSTSSTCKDSIAENELPLEENKDLVIKPTNPFYENVNHKLVENASEPRSKYKGLSGPRQLGGGNPFLIFLCLTLILQHRDEIMSKSLHLNL